MAVRCPHCGEEAITWEGYDGQGEDQSQRVCHSCGVILEEGSFRSNDLEPGQQNIAYNPEYSANGTESMSLPQGYMNNLRSVIRSKSIAQGHNIARKKIKTLMRIISPNDTHILQQANGFLDRALELSTFNKQPLEKREFLAGCCVTLACRAEGLPITFGYIAMLLNCSATKLKAEFCLLNRSLNFKLQPLDIEALLDNLCSKQSPECLQLTKQILALSQKTWITNGRQLEPIVLAASFYAWQSLDFVKRQNVKLGEYLAQYDRKVDSKTTVRYREIGRILLTLSSAIPWLANKKLNFVKVIPFLPDILKYQRSLFLQLEQQEQETDCTTTTGSKQEQETDCTTTTGSIQEDSTTNPDSDDTSPNKCHPDGKSMLKSDPILNDAKANSTDHQFPCNLAKSESSTTCVAGKFELSSLKRDVDGTPKHLRSVKHLFFPKSMLKLPPQTVTENTSGGAVCHPDIDSPKLSEADIPDSEMGLYLKEDWEQATRAKVWEQATRAKIWEQATRAKVVRSKLKFD